ncbi:MAG TPA: D-Ala-D-Ala carboxypeptidase family metallohydrolase [Sphingomicrobium sp.]|nr:D-Ala-D-Ala carboxypeptidase family metallohydrolase [Sphingomicrobium sp.]
MRSRSNPLLVREGDVRDRYRYLWLLLVIGAPSAAVSRLKPVYPHPGQTVAAAAMRIASPFGVITSTSRSVEHNRAVGGVSNSYHLLGRAMDVARKPGVTHARIAAALTAAGFHLIESLDEGDHSHFAFGFASDEAAAPIQPPPQGFSRNQLAADHHGALRLDLGRQLGRDEARSHWSGWGRPASH